METTQCPEGVIEISEMGDETRVCGRVLMLLENNSYPQDTRVKLEARALTDGGYQVTVVCPRAQGQPWGEAIDGVRIRRYPAPPQAASALAYVWEYGYSMAAAFVLSILVAAGEGFDVIHAHNPPDTYAFIAAFYRLFGKRFVFDQHELAPELYRARFAHGGSWFIHSLLVGLEKLSCKLADHVIATNESYKAMQMNRDSVSERCITVVRNGPELSEFRSAIPDPELRQRGKPIIGYIGTMGYQDGVDCLLRALGHLVHDLGRDECFCVLIGDGSAISDLKALANELGIDRHVWFTGWLPALEFVPLLAATDICVDPDPSNPFNDRSTMIKMMEYMALGKPIVAFDLPEHRYTAQAAALYVPANDEQAFARAIAQLADNLPRREVMGASGRRRVEARLAWSYSIPALLAVYRAVLSGRRPARVPEQRM